MSFVNLLSTSNPFPLILDTIANKLHLQKVNDFNLSPGTQPYKVILAFIYIEHMFFLLLKSMSKTCISVSLLLRIKYWLVRVCLRCQFTSQEVKAHLHLLDYISIPASPGLRQHWPIKASLKLIRLQCCGIKKVWWVIFHFCY